MLKDTVKKQILRDLIRLRIWGGKHTEIRNLSKGFSDYISNSKQFKKIFDKVIKELINLNWLLAKKSTKEWHVSLNPKKKEEIYRFLKLPPRD